MNRKSLDDQMSEVHALDCTFSCGVSAGRMYSLEQWERERKGIYRIDPLPKSPYYYQLRNMRKRWKKGER